MSGDAEKDLVRTRDYHARKAAAGRLRELIGILDSFLERTPDKDVLRLSGLCGQHGDIGIVNARTLRDDLKAILAIPDDEELLRRVVSGCHNGQKPRWRMVMTRFGLGSTSAQALCRRFGFDPDEVVNRSALQRAGRRRGDL